MGLLEPLEISLNAEGGLVVDGAPEEVLISERVIDMVAEGMTESLTLERDVLTITAANGVFVYRLVAPEGHLRAWRAERV